MEETLQFNRQTIDEIKQVLHYLADNKEHIDWKRLYQLIATAEQQKHPQSSTKTHSAENRVTSPKQMVSVVPEYCGFSESAPSKTDIQVCLIVILNAVFLPSVCAHTIQHRAIKCEMVTY